MTRLILVKIRDLFGARFFFFFFAKTLIDCVELFISQSRSNNCNSIHLRHVSSISCCCQMERCQATSNNLIYFEMSFQN